jgi:hypothetical protein
LLPLAVAVWYLINSGKYTQNNIMTTTLLNYNYVMKPMMTLTRIPDVLVYAGEYLTRPVPDSHKAAVFQLSTALKKHHPEVRLHCVVGFVAAGVPALYLRTLDDTRMQPSRVSGPDEC